MSTSDVCAIPDPCRYRRVLIIRLSAIGDVLRTLPALNAWWEACPQTRFTWLVEPAAASVLEGHPALEKVLVFERRLWSGSWRSPRRLGRGLAVSWALLRELRAQKFDLVLDAHGILKSALLARLSGARERVGFARPDAKEGSQLFYQRCFKPTGVKLNRVDRALQLTAFLGVAPAGPPRYHLALTADHRQAAAASLFELNQLTGNGPLLVLHPGSSPKTAYKRWHQNGYVGLINALVEKLAARVLLTWGPGERETVELIAGQVRVPVAVAGKTSSLLDLAAIFAACDLFVGGDTGPMHLAAAVGTPVVAIFGPTHPQVNAPCGVPWRLVRYPLFCSPCRKRSCKSRLCLEAVGWRRVLVEVEGLLHEIKKQSLVSVRVPGAGPSNER
ncbi:MAG: glycosyltransferase family 9 protein [Deltaproteobacteria bacterium]|nr:glycosyltransferase family 9 protein [Deltaproteobacteria bacterium]